MSGRLSTADRTRVRVALHAAVEGRDRVMVGDVARQVSEATGVTYSASTIAGMLRPLGFGRARQGIYARRGRAS